MWGFFLFSIVMLSIGFLLWVAIELLTTGPDGNRYWPEYDDLEGKDWGVADDE